MTAAVHHTAACYSTREINFSLTVCIGYKLTFAKTNLSSTRVHVALCMYIIMLDYTLTRRIHHGAGTGGSLPAAPGGCHQSRDSRIPGRIWPISSTLTMTVTSTHVPPSGLHWCRAPSTALQILAHSPSVPDCARHTYVCACCMS